ncbi:MAG: CAP domain-containing protein [Roseburia sp.]|nr:CAP domain-containing protein [Roseburia sp.]
MKRIICLIGIFSLLAGVFADRPDVAGAKTVPVLNKKAATLTVGKTVRLKLRNYTKKIRWSSSRKSVAVVSPRGVVTAKKAGSARITARAGGKKYVCRVTVKAKTTTKSSFARKVLNLVNKERAKEGLKPLKLDTALCQAAKLRAEEITENFDHTRPDGSSCFTILKENNISYRAAGENIAAGQPTPEQVVEGWMNSPGHRENIMSKEFGKLGVGYVKADDEYGHYWVQLFSD